MLQIYDLKFTEISTLFKSVFMCKKTAKLCIVFKDELGNLWYDQNYGPYWAAGKVPGKAYIQHDEYVAVDLNAVFGNFRTFSEDYEFLGLL